MIFCDVAQNKVVRFEKKNYQCIKKTSLEGRINVSIGTHHKFFISLFIFCLQESYECCEKKKKNRESLNNADEKQKPQLLDWDQVIKPIKEGGLSILSMKNACVAW